ncbi:molybdopterin biosynthesis protein [Desulfoferrobacter suflitae]|uniref:molybdopterin biosynthesis protein n=1 Tax=Desulfoferrobacter suflitae TaxID=2865782 RepID=UPI00216411F4|nr:molybdopterin biosynthesis protein [Desulfoferrobacter suflitae]MCK8602318.1 molybdopterin biosynthesis protein [Desulfoferrobacter suflitae]
MKRQHRRNIYLTMKTLEQARTIWSAETSSVRAPVETIPAAMGLGRVTAAPVTARHSVPHYHGAAMDGIAVQAEDTFGASDVNPVRLVLGHNAHAVDTGDPLPSGTDAVIMIEHVEQVGDAAVEIRGAAFPWQHVRKVGEDIVAGELLIPQNHRLRPADLGALLAAGVTSVSVFTRPRVSIQPTGTELIPADRASQAKPGEIIEFNGVVLSAMVAECGGEPLMQPGIVDDYESIKLALQRAVDSDADVVLVNAGSSAGSEDYTAEAIGELGEVFVHGVTMMPGKPTILGMVKGKPVVGIPGYPVSAILAFEQFVRPLLFAMQGLAPPAFAHVEANLGRKMPSRLGLEEFVRVILGRVRGDLVAMPLQRGAGVITSLTRADGMLQVPQESEGHDAGERVRIRLLRPEESLEDTLIMIGSHDNTIDVLANELKIRNSRLHLSSSNVGSLGGLLAVRRGQTHFAGSHLLDTETGDFNSSYIARYLPGVPVRLVELTMRRQGLLLLAGNPKGIKGVEDLRRPDVRLINRQAGSGTRILLDYQLQRRNISPDDIAGYDQDEFTHMAVAVNVLSGRADTGMAIFAAAKALGLDFIPVAEERYDLVIPDSSWDDPKMQLVLEIIGTAHFRRRLAALGGYDASNSGRVVGRWDGQKWL